MWRFAWRNLLTRPLRTALALVGLSIPILGVLGLFSVSGGLRHLVGDTLSQIEGVMVLRENALSPVFSDLPAELGARLAAIPGVRVVAAEVMKTAPEVEGRGMILKSVGGLLDPTRTKEQRMQSLFDQPLIQGQDLAAHARLKSAVFPNKLLPGEEGGGRFLDERDRGQPHIVISRKIARDFPIAQASGGSRPRRVGDSLSIGGKPYEIVGIYDTGSMLLDVVIVMDIDSARSLLGVSPETVSSYYVEATDPGGIEQVATEIERRIVDPRIDARSMSEFTASFGQIMGQLDTFLLMMVSLALVVGVVGIINTMLMSTTERFAEFGVLRTNGWSQGNVLSLVTAESAFLGLLAGIVGCVLAVAGTVLVNQFLGGGLQLEVTPRLILLGLALSIVMGTLGGLYPAWRAARLVPMDAIRLGAH
jgi:putative ABC transport system permease protein